MSNFYEQEHLPSLKIRRSPSIRKSTFLTKLTDQSRSLPIRSQCSYNPTSNRLGVISQLLLLPLETEELIRPRHRDVYKRIHQTIDVERHMKHIDNIFHRKYYHER
jgi:hypothetical protein